MVHLWSMSINEKCTPPYFVMWSIMKSFKSYTPTKWKCIHKDPYKYNVVKYTVSVHPKSLYYIYRKILISKETQEIEKVTTSLCQSKMKINKSIRVDIKKILMIILPAIKLNIGVYLNTPEWSSNDILISHHPTPTVKHTMNFRVWSWSVYQVWLLCAYSTLRILGECHADIKNDMLFWLWLADLG